jgi:AraC family transcriptional regulator
MTMELRPGQNYGSTVESADIGSFRFSDSVYPPGCRTPTHSHGQALVFLVIRGSGIETFGRRSCILTPSTLVFHPAGLSHREQVNQTGARALLIEIEAEWLRRIRVLGAGTDRPARSCGGIPSLLGARVYREFRRRDDVSPLIIEGLMLEMMGEVSRGASGSPVSQAPRWLKNAREFVFAGFTGKLTLDEIAGAVGVHPMHLARSFRKTYQCSVGDYIRQLRAEYACKQLVTSDTPLVEIAHQAGFCDQSHLTRAVKRHTGLTPLQYRSLAE